MVAGNQELNIMMKALTHNISTMTLLLTSLRKVNMTDLSVGKTAPTASIPPSATMLQGPLNAKLDPTCLSRRIPQWPVE